MHWKEDNGIVTLLGSQSLSLERRADDGGARLLLFIGGGPNYGPWVARCGIFEMDPDYDDHCGCGWDLSLLHHLDVDSCQKSFVYDATDAKGTREQSHFGPSAYSAALTVRATIHVRARKLNRPTDRPMAGQIDRPSLSAFSLLCSV